MEHVASFVWNRSLGPREKLVLFVFVGFFSLLYDILRAWPFAHITQPSLPHLSLWKQHTELLAIKLYHTPCCVSAKAVIVLRLPVTSHTEEICWQLLFLVGSFCLTVMDWWHVTQHKQRQKKDKSFFCLSSNIFWTYLFISKWFLNAYIHICIFKCVLTLMLLMGFNVI